MHTIVFFSHWSMVLVSRLHILCFVLDESFEEMDCSDSEYSLSSHTRRVCSNAPTISTSSSSSPPDLRVTDCGRHRTTGGSGTAITLSDSDEDSDIEILPLASRINNAQNTRSLGDSPAAVADDLQQWVAETPMCDGGGGGGGSSDEVVVRSSRRGGEGERAECKSPMPRVERRTQTDSMTPAQMAGQAALRRLEKFGGCGGGSCKSEVMRSKRRKVDFTVREINKKDVRPAANLASQNKHKQEEFPPVILSSSSQPSQHQAPTTSAPSLSSHTQSSVSTSTHHPPSSLPQSTTAVQLSKPLFQLKPGIMYVCTAAVHTVFTIHVCFMACRRV